jgi:hypothetical protein
MARTLVRPSLYDQDFLAWTEQQAALLRARRLDQLDLDNLAEELDTMGRSERGELENRLEVLFHAHAEVGLPGRPEIPQLKVNHARAAQCPSPPDAAQPQLAA